MSLSKIIGHVEFQVRELPEQAVELITAAEKMSDKSCPPLGVCVEKALTLAFCITLLADIITEPFGVATSIVNSGNGMDPHLQRISKKITLFAISLICLIPGMKLATFVALHNPMTAAELQIATLRADLEASTRERAESRALEQERLSELFQALEVLDGQKDENAALKVDNKRMADELDQAETNARLLQEVERSGQFRFDGWERFMDSAKQKLSVLPEEGYFSNRLQTHFQEIRERDRRVEELQERVRYLERRLAEITQQAHHEDSSSLAHS
ncbi:MAG: hypothetical protein S4CHLAM102_09940 [Chlamydiia bacterium]|nr:hypothetical protein [Chlamydiia bacterium]